MFILFIDGNTNVYRGCLLKICEFSNLAVCVEVVCGKWWDRSEFSGKCQRKDKGCTQDDGIFYANIVLNLTTSNKFINDASGQNVIDFTCFRYHFNMEIEMVYRSLRSLT